MNYEFYLNILETNEKLILLLLMLMKNLYHKLSLNTLEKLPLPLKKKNCNSGLIRRFCLLLNKQKSDYSVISF